MTPADRIITSAFVLELNRNPDCDDLQLSHAVLDRLETDAFHVLIPVGHTHGLTEPRIVCQAQLAVGGDSPLEKEVLISPEIYESLPTAFSVLNTVEQLMPMAVAELDDELNALLASGHGPLAEVLGDEDGDIDPIRDDQSAGGPLG